ncbi:hypothetical protein DFJ63DRAFT_215963 [Scheffersomyces coipomensis]|uniref:uncharacterized protein n=1 Tax=Scheffersomyces coipomensis TaxID=1788519 RepID=UPI00315DF520
MVSFNLIVRPVFHIVVASLYVFGIGLIMNDNFSILAICYMISLFLLLVGLFILSMSGVEDCQHPGNLRDNVFQFQNLHCTCIRGAIYGWSLIMLFIIFIIAVAQNAETAHRARVELHANC